MAPVTGNVPALEDSGTTREAWERAAYDEPVSLLEANLRTGAFVTTAEIAPPLGASGDVLLKKVGWLKGYVAAANFTDNASASARMSSMASSKLCLDAGLEPVMQLQARDRSRVVIESDGLGAAGLGIRNILCLSGDHHKFGPPPMAKPDQFDLDAVQVLWLLRRMRDEGVYLDGRPIKQRPQFFLGAAASPFGAPPQYEAIRAEKNYTGEDGFEIYTRDPDPGIIWATLIETGRPRGLQPIGLGARDTLRLESKLMLYGNDISDKTTVLEADLRWIVKLPKGDFLGKPVIEKQLAEGLQRKLVGFEMAEPGIARPHYPVFYKSQRVGEVASGTFSLLLKKAIGLVYLPIDGTAFGKEFEIEIRGRRTRARVIPTPFYKRAKK